MPETTTQHVTLNAHNSTLESQRIEIIAPLSSGAQAKACLARDAKTGEKVFLKILNAAELDNWKSFELFQRESKTLQNLAHPQIPQYIDSFQDEDGNFCLIQKYIDAPAIARLLTEGKVFQSVEIIDIGLQILQILDYLRKCDPPVIHRDIKPSNILYDDGKKAYLVDFGLVADFGKDDRGSTIAGTAGYMAPEQLMGNAQPASDIFGLFATLLHLLTGVPPSAMPTVTFRLQIRPYLEDFPYDLYRLFKECLHPVVSERKSDIPTIARELEHIKDIFLKKVQPRPWSAEQMEDISHIDNRDKELARVKNKRKAAPLMNLYCSKLYSPLKPGLADIPTVELLNRIREGRDGITNYEKNHPSISLKLIKLTPFALGGGIIFIIIGLLARSIEVLGFGVAVAVLIPGLIFLFLLLDAVVLKLADRDFRKHIARPLKIIAPMATRESLVNNLSLISEAPSQIATIANIERFENSPHYSEHCCITIRFPHPKHPDRILTMSKNLSPQNVDGTLKVGDEVPIRVDLRKEDFVFFPGPFFE